MEGRLFATAISTLVPQFRLKAKPNIENFAFKLHYKATVAVLIAFVIVVCAREFFGDHIKCIYDKGVAENFIQTYCFFMGTFTIARHYNESLLQSGVLPHPGVGPMAKSDKLLRHTYYQWVPFVLFLQCICFYMPHYVWKKKEGGRLKALVDGLQHAGINIHDDDIKVGGKILPSKKALDKKLEVIRQDVLFRLHNTSTWSVWLVAMEVANLFHVMFQIWVTNMFLNGQFLGMGSQIIGFRNWNGIIDPLDSVFPKVTKCIFWNYGPSGGLQPHDVLCVMALNVIHKKIYIILWFWLLFLFIASLLAVIWRIASMFLYHRSLRFNELMFQRATGGKANSYNVINVVNGCQYGDWLFIYYLAKNMQGFVFRELFAQLAEELEDQKCPKRKILYGRGTRKPPISRVDYTDEGLPCEKTPLSVFK